MREVILDSWMSYEGVKRQVTQILDLLASSCRSGRVELTPNANPEHASAVQSQPALGARSTPEHYADPESDDGDSHGPHPGCPSHYGGFQAGEGTACEQCELWWDCRRIAAARQGR